MAAAIACGAAGATGCLYLVDLNGLSGGETTPADGSLGDGALGGDTNAIVDAASGADARSDAATADAAVEASPCTASHAFCADFDHGGVSLGWTTTTNDTPGTLALDDLALSAPHAMRTMRPQPTVGAVTLFQKQLVMGWRRVILQADIYLSAPAWQPGDVNIGLMEVSFDSDTVHSGTLYFIDPVHAEGTIEHLPDTAERYLPVDAPSPARWVHMLVDFDPAGHVHYEVDGVSFDRTFAAVTPGPNPAIYVGVGALQYNMPAPAVDVRFDNVFADMP